MTQGLELRGAVLGKGYRLGRRIDDSEEHVYEATHERLPGHFVIRTFPPELLTQAESSSRIQRGARVASLLRDPRVVQVLDCSVSGEVPVFVVMERAKGRPLGAAMSEDGMFPLARVVPLIESLAEALAAGHQIGLVHGDIRPAHIVLPTGDGPAARLAGFGWAKELRAAARLPFPSGYLAPEQQFGKVLTLDERVDQFGLAALAYELIAACLPFSEESTDLADLETPRIPPAVADLVPGIPKQLDEILRRALSFKPAERYPNILDLATQLRGLLTATGGRTAPSPTPASDHSVTVVAAMPMRRHSDVTEELDLAALSSVGTSGEIDARDDLGIETEFAAAASVDEGDDDVDAKLVLGTRRPAATAVDNEKTQIRRSPFLTAEDNLDPTRDDLDGDGEGAATDTVPAFRPLALATAVPPPKRGIPAGRPVWPRPGEDSGSTRRPPHGVSGAASAGAARLAGLWQGIKLRKAWTFPLATGVLLLVLVGAMIAISRDSDSEVAAGAPSRTPSQPTHAAAGPPSGSTAAPAAAPIVVPPVPPPTPAPVAGTSVAEPPPAGPPSRASEPLAAAVPPSALPSPEPTPAVADGHQARAVAPAAPRPAAAGRRMVVNPTAAPAASSPAAAARTIPGVGPNDCTIRISSRPWAEVWIDGKNTGRKTPIDNLKVACGSRKLELKRPDKDIEQMEMLQVTPGKPYLGSYDLE